MSRFKPGQEVVCIDDDFVHAKECDHDHPKIGEVVTVLEYRNNTFFRTVEYPQISRITKQRRSFLEDCFAPVMNISELTEILNQQPQEV